MRLSSSLVAVALLVLVACTRTNFVTIEMETCYQVFDPLLGELRAAVTGESTAVRRAFVRIQPSLVEGLNSGDSVVVAFQQDGDHLIPVKVYPLSTPSDSVGMHTLAGRLEGREVVSSLGLIGFEFPVTKAELDATAYTKGLRKLILVHFTEGGGALKYHHLEIIRELVGDPLIRK